MLISVLFIFLAALIAPFLPKNVKKSAGLLFSLIPLTILIYFLQFFEQIINGEQISTTFTWVESLNIHVTFYLDGLSFLFSLLILSIGVLIFIYSHGYMKSSEHIGKFFSYMLLFMGAMLGLVISGNLITMFVFWELTSITSFLLIGFHNENKKARSAALQAIIVTELGGLCLLAGFILIGNIGGNYEIHDLLSKKEVLIENSLYLPILFLMIVGAFTKSAQFPFHFWLPSAMKAPTPVSAYLHSAAMVNAGIYLLARLHPILGGTEEWQSIITFFGGATMLIGAYFSLTQKDLKGILAYTTISALGIIIMLIGIGTSASVKAALTYLLIHAFYKATLFMISGAIDKNTGTRNIIKLGNLKKEMPVTTVISLLALLSMAGLPPMMGYIGKEFIYEATKQAPDIAIILLIFTIIASILMVTISIVFGYSVFFKKDSSTRNKLREPSITLLFGPAVLSGFSLLFVFLPKPVEPLLEIASSVVKASSIEVEFKLWHGFNLIFLLSLITILLGVAVFLKRKKIFPLSQKVNEQWLRVDFAHTFNRIVQWLLRFAKKNTSFFQHGYYRFYLMSIFIITAILVWYQIYLTWNWIFLENISPVIPYVTILAGITVIAAIAVVFTNSRLIAIIIMGVVGYGIALIYLIYGAIDLAITQILVETLTLVLFVMVFNNLPQYIKKLSKISKFRDAAISLAVGGFMAGLVLKSDHLHLSQPVSEYIADKSYTEDLGRNIVNVILVDFRAFDTLGETMVLGIAALGIFTLLKIKKSNNKV